MDGFTVIARSEDAGDLGHATFSKNELAAFLAIDYDIEVVCDLTMLKEGSPSLQLTLTVGSLPSSDTTTGVGSVLDTMEDTERFSRLLESLSKDLPKLNSIGELFCQRFCETNREDDINKAISAYELAVKLAGPDDASYGTYVRNVGLALHFRFQFSGNLPDINKAISMMQVALASMTEGDVNFSGQINNLGIAFRDRFNRTGDIADLESAISNHQRAALLTPEGHPDMPSTLSNLGLSFHERFGTTGDIADIKSAISNFQRAIQLTPERHLHIPTWLNNLGNSFLSLFESTGDIADIDSAISNQQRAIQLTSEEHLDMPKWLNNLGLSFHARFKCTGDITDLESAIYNQQRGIQLTRKEHPDMPSQLNHLAISFRTRFERTGDISDLESAISNEQRAVEPTSKGNPHIPSRLNDLGVSFRARFKHSRDIADIEKAISNLQKAAQIASHGHPDMPAYLHNLGISFRARFQHTEEIADLESAILNLQRAVQLTPKGHPDAPSHLNSLGNSFLSRFKRTRDIADLESAIFNQQEAVQLTPTGHSDMTSRLNSLASSFFYRFESTKRLEDVNQTISTCRLAATQSSGHPSHRLHAAKIWINLSYQFDRSQTLDAFSVAIGLLSQLAGLEQTIHKRHNNLTDASDLIASAAAIAIDDDEIETALVWLEQGHCIVWNQLNQLRTPIDDLSAYNPSLAIRFLQVAHALDLSGSRYHGDMIAAQDITRTHVHLAKAWDELLSEIRQIPIFQDFLQPPKATDLLQRLSLDGPVIIFNIHKYRCDAIALISGADSPLHIPLETFSIQQAIRLRDDLRRYLTGNRVLRREVDRGMRRGRDSKGIIMYQVLRDLWQHVAKPILDALGYSLHNTSRSRIWWCPTGPLAFLPIHAAGIYGKDKTPVGSCVSDYVISSYIPTISACFDKIKDAVTTDHRPSSLLLISQPSTPGQGVIPAARKETHALQDMMQAASIESLLLEDSSATTIRVKEEMNTHSWSHFACHAIQDVDEPLRSGIELHDGRLELLQMMKQKIPNADFAFLSACQTSTGDEKLSDEVVHIAAGMLAAGYRGVVATMWSIQDKFGPVVAKDFYEHILEANLGGSWLDSANAARALHHATQKFREKLGDTEEALLAWVPYVHFGI